MIAEGNKKVDVEKYDLVEIFFSIQGEGRFTGERAIFVRFAHCNRHCSFCDTETSPRFSMTEDELAQAIWDLAYEKMCDRVIFTGGEPLLQLKGSLCKELHTQNLYLAVETNGTVFPEVDEDDLDWITVSPKEDFNRAAWLFQDHGIDEVKVVLEKGQELQPFPWSMIHRDGSVKREELSFASPAMPLELTPENYAETQETIRWCAHQVAKSPGWQMTMQSHKVWGIR